MTEMTEGTLLWEPSERLKEQARISDFMRWLEAERDLSFDGYADLWEWSVKDIEGFWSSLWEYCGVKPSQPYERVLGSREMPGTEWFAGAELNYAEHALLHADERPDEPALIHQSEIRPRGETTWRELRERVGAVAAVSGRWASSAATG
jgi:acetoacetyl-CoA synthetase